MLVYTNISYQTDITEMAFIVTCIHPVTSTDYSSSIIIIILHSHLFHNAIIQHLVGDGELYQRPWIGLRKLATSV